MDIASREAAEARPPNDKRWLALLWSGAAAEEDRPTVRAREQLDQRSARLVSGQHLGRGAAPRDDGDPQFGGGLDHLDIEYWRNEKTSTGRDRIPRLLRSQDRARPDRHIRILAGDGLDVLKCPGNRQGELSDTKSSGDGGFHRIDSKISVGSSQYGTGTSGTQFVDK